MDESKKNEQTCEKVIIIDSLHCFNGIICTENCTDCLQPNESSVILPDGYGDNIEAMLKYIRSSPPRRYYNPHPWIPPLRVTIDYSSIARGSVFFTDALIPSPSLISLDGIVCSKCNTFYDYELNIDNEYICDNCRVNDE